MTIAPLALTWSTSRECRSSDCCMCTTPTFEPRWLGDDEPDAASDPHSLVLDVGVRGRPGNPEAIARSVSSDHHPMARLHPTDMDRREEYRQADWRVALAGHGVPFGWQSCLFLGDERRSINRTITAGPRGVSVSGRSVDRPITPRMSASSDGLDRNGECLPGSTYGSMWSASRAAAWLHRGAIAWSSVQMIEANAIAWPTSGWRSGALPRTDCGRNCEVAQPRTLFERA